MVTKEEGGVRRDGLGGWDSQMQTVIEREWMNRVPLCSAGKCSQYPEINHNGKEYGKQCMYYIYKHTTCVYYIIHCIYVN